MFESNVFYTPATNTASTKTCASSGFQCLCFREANSKVEVTVGSGATPIAPLTPLQLTIAEANGITLPEDLTAVPGLTIGLEAANGAEGDVTATPFDSEAEVSHTLFAYSRAAAPPRRRRTAHCHKRSCCVMPCRSR